MSDPAEEATGRLRSLLLANRGGRAVGVPSVCSAEPAVLGAALAEARAAGGLAVIEATCNQVNQDGGYTGMTPAAFRSQVEQLAVVEGVADASLVLGGDHLGPYPWRAAPPGVAMEKARRLVRAFVTAGFTKIHLDASMPLSGEVALDDEQVLARTVELCAVAEEARRGLALGAPAPLYVIGSEVPAPGGEPAGAGGPSPTEPDDVRRFVDGARAAFEAAGLDDAWRRVVAVVVQPGVEFDAWAVRDYVPQHAGALSALIAELPALVYEAHSTDYQTGDALAGLVRDHFAILKVGPALTFAYREALFGLEAIEVELIAGGLLAGVEPSRLRATLEAAMLAEPSHWQGYYAGDAGAQAMARAFGFSDRVRYYWPKEEVRDAILRLFRNVSAGPLPGALLSQFLPLGYEAVRSGESRPEPLGLVRHHVRAALRPYWAACAG
jgi:D-tagatose-1,6-bisphosphate aldolase subunit GatZ/KbaZ